MCTIGILGQSHRRCTLVTNGEHACVVVGVCVQNFRDCIVLIELTLPVILYRLKNTLMLPLDCEVHVSWLTGIFTDLLGRSAFPFEEIEKVVH